MSDIRFNRWLHQSGTGGVYQDSTGRVGIGTSVPTSALDVQSGTIKIGSNTLSSSGVSTFTSITATTVTATSIVGVSTAGITTVYVSSVNEGPISGFRNKIINGDMRISQRGATFSTLDPASDTYTLDRWVFGGAGTTGRATITQSGDNPTSGFSAALRVDVTTADTSIAAGDLAIIVQRIEGFNVRDLIETTFTLSFWVKSPKTGVHCVSFINSAADRSFVAEYNVISANTWEKKSIIVVGGLITAGTWNWDNGIGLRVGFTLCSGSTFQTTAGSWQTGNFFGTSNQVNVLDNTANDFFLGGVQLETGPVASPFERRLYGQEVALCQRYFCKSYDLATAPGAASHEENASIVIATSTTRASAFVRFPVEMRADPNITSYSTAGTSGGISLVNSLSTAVTGVTFANNHYSQTGFQELNVTTGFTAGTHYQMHWTASAEL